MNVTSIGQTKLNSYKNEIPNEEAFFQTHLKGFEGQVKFWVDRVVAQGTAITYRSEWLKNK